VGGQSAGAWPRVNALPPLQNVNNNVGFGLDATLAKLTPDGGALVYSTFLGGTREDRAMGVAVDQRGNAYLTGITYSPSFPLIAAFDTTCANCASSGPIPGSAEAFVARISLLNLAPAGVADEYSTDEDVELVVPAPGVVANDSDLNGDALSAVLVTGPAHGVLELDAAGSFRYTPDGDYHGPDGFVYKAADGALESAATAVSLTVSPVNDAPIADAGGPYTVTAGGTIPLQGSGTDVEGSALQFDWDLDADHVFETAGPTPTFSAGPAPGTAVVRLRVTDADGATGTAEAPITITARPLDAVDDALTVLRPRRLRHLLDVLANDVAGTAGGTLRVTAVTQPERGRVRIVRDGKAVAFRVGFAFRGTVTFTYTVGDGLGGLDTATATVTVMAPVP
jgi:hypothetical protein